MERGAGLTWFENRELAFLRNVRLLYQDYLDGSPLHRSDTKASVQLLGNLALGNLRRSHLGHLLREGRTIDRLDLSRSGGLFGGPYLWFNYITRMLVQETALLILDYNRHAVPRRSAGVLARRRSARSFGTGWPTGSRSTRRRSGCRSSRRPRTRAGRPLLSGACPATSAATARAAERSPRREAGAFLETVEFTAVDFLADDPERDAEIHARFGPQVAELVRRDRQQNVRRAFRSFPLHELPLAARTINPFALLRNPPGRRPDRPLAVHPGSRPGTGRPGSASAASTASCTRSSIPRSTASSVVPSDTYWAALRKIHRMRKPVFMGSLWLRARFDVEYLGLPLPTAPPGIAGAVAHGDRPRLHRGDPPGPDHRRAGPPPAPEAAGMGGRAGSIDSAGPSTSCRATSPRRSPSWPIAAARRCGLWWPRASSTTTTSPRSPCRSKA